MVRKLCLWRDGALYLGDSLDPHMHAHQAVQCCIAIQGELQLAWGEADAWQTCSAAVIGANVPHRIANPDGPLCLLYLEKASHSSQSILDYHCTETGCDVRRQPLLLNKPVPSPLRGDLWAAMTQPLGHDRAMHLRQACLALFQGALSEPEPLDLRLNQLLEYIHSHLDQGMSGPELAAVAKLSESRMQHLFKARLGVPVRRYVLWSRLRAGLEQALAGASLTSAALAAGFSDSAHFSRTFREMFGIAPSMLLAAGSGLETLFCDAYVAPLSVIAPNS